MEAEKLALCCRRSGVGGGVGGLNLNTVMRMGRSQISGVF